MTPKLTAKIVADERAVVARIERLLRADIRHRTRTETVLRRQERLHDSVCPDQWEMFERLGEVVDARFAEAALLIVRWAFAEGFRHAGAR